MSTNDYPQYEKEIPQYEVLTQNHFKYTLPNSVSFGQIMSASPTPNQITCQFSATTCADFSEEMSSWGYVNLPQLKVPPVSHSSRFSSPLSSESSLDGEEGIERSRLQYKTRNYLAKPYLQTPPSTISECSPRAPSSSDGRSRRSTAYFASPRSNDEDELETDERRNNNGPRPSLSFGRSSSPSAGFSYPQTIDELYHGIPQTPSTSNESLLLIDGCQWAMNQTHSTSELDPRTNQSDALQLYEAVVKVMSSGGFQLDGATCQNLMGCLDQRLHDLTQKENGQIAKTPLLSGQNFSRSPLSESSKTTIATKDANFNAFVEPPECQGNLMVDTSNASELEAKDKAVPQQPLDMCLKRGDVAQWSLQLPDTFHETVGAQSPSTSILMATAEEDLEKRVKLALCQDSVLAQALLSRLKNDLPFLLPLFCEEEESSPFEAPQFSSYAADERGSSGKAASSSAPSTTGSKSNTENSITTPATSADFGRDSIEEDANDDGPRLKRRRTLGTQRHGDQVRRRFRCHFHAKSPSIHCQKICILNGWLSIHHLRQHYRANHTVIRCHKCFMEFQTKPERNRHQLTCDIPQQPPILEKIDCFIQDEIDHVLKGFRTWRLDTEEDQELKDWIVKYRGESANKDVPTDDATDPRELAKWYRIWMILFPSFQKPVPSPFQDASMSPGDMKLERWLAMFQKLVETQVEQNRPPPADIAQQIEYYKDAFRTIHRIAMNESDPNSTLESPGENVDDPSIPNSINFSTNTFAPSDSLGRQLPIDGDSATFERPRHPASLTPGSSTRSPFSAETSGAVGESPVIKKSVKPRLASGNDAPRRVIDYQTTMPPPCRDQPAHTISSQSLDPQYQNPQGDFTLSMSPIYASDATMFNFTGIAGAPGPSRWNVQMAQAQASISPTVCPMCNGTRTVTFNSQMQECLVCNPFFMQN